jgi:osmotically-inducible protein OsmY
VEALIQRQLLGRVRLRRFRVLVQEQGVVLQGCAPTYYAKQLAQHAAMEVSGRSILANEIEVQ